MYRVCGNVPSIESLQNEVNSNGSVEGVTYYEDEKETLLEALEQMKETIGFLDENGSSVTLSLHFAKVSGTIQ